MTSLFSSSESLSSIDRLKTLQVLNALLMRAFYKPKTFLERYHKNTLINLKIILENRESIERITGCQPFFSELFIASLSYAIEKGYFKNPARKVLKADEVLSAIEFLAYVQHLIGERRVNSVLLMN